MEEPAKPIVPLDAAALIGGDDVGALARSRANCVSAAALAAMA
jgi:hypothetical protein